MAFSLTESIRNEAMRLGFDLMAVARADDLKQDEWAMERWLEEGRHGEMTYLLRDPKRRTRPGMVLSDAKSVIVLAMNYFHEEGTGLAEVRPAGRIARYAWGKDYHQLIESRLSQIEAYIRAQAGPAPMLKSYVDHGPVLEKAFARESGIGFIGKNTLLITEPFGSWVFLSVILTSLELDYGDPQTSQCGSCRLCLEACPTGALTHPYRLDARKCISYHTIENRGEIPDAMKPHIGNWVFGCDICQEVCPFNASARGKPLDELRPEHGMGPAIDPVRILEEFKEGTLEGRIAKTPLRRAGIKGLRRNAELVMGNVSQKTHREPQR